MKKIKLLGLALASMLVLNSCGDDLMNVETESTMTGTDLQNYVRDYPEKAFVLLSGIEAGNTLLLSDFGTIGNYHDDFGINAYKLGLDFMSNDITMTTSNWFVHYLNYTARQEASLRTRMIWSFFYKVIGIMNDGLVLIPDDPGVAPEVKYIKARYLAMRADAYFNLVRIYADGNVGVPLALEDPALSVPGRVPTSEINAMIEADLLEAYALIEGYSRPTKEYINKNVIAGMLARYYQQVGNWPQAANYSQQAMAGFTIMNSAQLMDGFNKISNPEWMWGADINTQTKTTYASFFSNMGNLNPGYAGQLQSYKTIDKRIFDQIPAGDARKGWFLDAGNAYGLPKYSNIKYVDDTNFEGDYVYMRAGEMALINAEANAHLNPAQGKAVLDAFVQTRNPGFSAPTAQAALLDEIYFQRSLELWGEGGNAFFDMKRLGKGLNRAYPGSNHTINQLVYPAGSPKFIFQIPLNEMDNNPAITQQNPL